MNFKAQRVAQRMLYTETGFLNSLFKHVMEGAGFHTGFYLLPYVIP